MALTQNEQLIIKYVAENFATKKSVADICPAYALQGQPEYSATWLSKTVDGTPLTPIQNRFYMVLNRGEIYTWTGRQYEQANLPDLITSQEVTEMWK
jgi:hypothetical protein